MVSHQNHNEAGPFCTLHILQKKQLGALCTSKISRQQSWLLTNKKNTALISPKIWIQPQWPSADPCFSGQVAGSSRLSDKHMPRWWVRSCSGNPGCGGARGAHHRGAARSTEDRASPRGSKLLGKSLLVLAGWLAFWLVISRRKNAKCFLIWSMYIAIYIAIYIHTVYVPFHLPYDQLFMQVNIPVLWILERLPFTHSGLLG